MTLVGAPDFQPQPGAPVTLLASIAISTSAVQSVSLQDVVQPNHSGLLFYWVPQGGLGYRGAIVVQTVNGVGGPLVTPITLVAANSQAVFPLPGSLVTSAFNGVLLLLATGPDGFVGTVAGTLHVFGLTSLPLSVPSPRQAFQGSAVGSGAINVAAGATITIIPAAASGTYTRVRLLTIGLTAALAAAQALFWAFATGPNRFARIEFVAGASNNSVVPVDFETIDGIVLVNGTASTVGASALYEVWPA